MSSERELKEKFKEEISQLKDMGYTESQCISAFKKCLTGKLEDAIQYLLENPLDKQQPQSELKVETKFTQSMDDLSNMALDLHKESQKFKKTYSRWIR